MVEEQPWDNETAARYIRQMARNGDLELNKTRHAEQRMSERGIDDKELRYVLRNGDVIGEPEPCPQAGLFKYKIQAQMPKRGAYVIRAVVVPYLETLCIMVITVMWAGRSPTDVNEPAGEMEAEK